MSMLDTQNKRPPLVNLHFDKGELIVKEGDYGLSIYKILKGHVKIFKFSSDTEIPLATLGPGEIFGEMTFLTRLLDPRSASARAIEDTELEAWHPARLFREYDQMPAIIKYIISHTLTRLNRMNRLVTELTLRTQKEREEETQQQEPKETRRKYYRKEFEMICVYRPVGSPPTVQLMGQLENLGRGGIRMNVIALNATRFPHNLEDEFELRFKLPNGQEIDGAAKIKWIEQDHALGQMRLGLEFTELKGGGGKSLGFFLMN